MIKQAIKRSVKALGYRIVHDLPEVGKAFDVLDLVVRDRYAGDGVFFVQIGANDGGENDPVSEYVTRYHWRGLLVEPLPKPYARLLERYRGEPQLRFENAAIGRSEGEVEFYCFRDDPRLPETVSQLASLDRRILLRHKVGVDDPESLITSIRVPQLSFPRLLEKHGVERIDLLFIDAEGYDFEILKMVDFASTRPSVIFFEDRHLGAVDYFQARKLLADQGYRLIRLNGDTIALQEDRA